MCLRKMGVLRGHRSFNGKAIDTMESNTPITKKGTRRKPGLWFSSMKVEVMDVKPTHKKVCSGCGKLPVYRRLMVTKGGGRHATTDVLCVHCGSSFLEQKELEAARAVQYLKGHLGVDEGIRL